MGVADDEMLEAALAVQVESSNWGAAAEIERLLALRGVAAGDHARLESHLTSGPNLPPVSRTPASPP